MPDSPIVLLFHEVVCILLIAIAVNATVLIFFGNILPTWFMGGASLAIGAAAMHKPVKRTLIELTKKLSE